VSVSRIQEENRRQVAYSGLIPKAVVESPPTTVVQLPQEAVMLEQIQRAAERLRGFLADRPSLVDWRIAHDRGALLKIDSLVDATPGSFRRLPK